jgi:hypothetical protein
MKRSILSKGLAALFAILILFTLAPTLAHAQTITNARALTADDSDVALLIERTDSIPGFVTVSAAGDILLEQVDNATADVNIECDASIAADGARNGTIDVSVAACDTLGEICDIINTQGDDEWACVILDGLATDTSASRSVDGGAQIKWDTSAAWTSTIALLPPELRKIEAYYYLDSGGNKVFHTNPWYQQGKQPSFVYANATSTFGSGTSTYSVRSVKLTFPNGNYNVDGTEVVTGPYYSIAGGATTANKEFSTFAANGLPFPVGEKVIARLTNSEAMATTTHIAIGAVK